LARIFRAQEDLLSFVRNKGCETVAGSVLCDSYVTTKEILWLKNLANLRDLILKKVMRPKKWVREKCFWVTRLANRFLWPDAVKSFSPSAQRAHITAARWRRV